MAAPENQVTKARATPKRPNWSSLLDTTSGIQIVADAANTAVATPVITPVGHEDPRSHVAQQEEPGAEPPHSARDGQRCNREEADPDPTVDLAGQTAEECRADEHGEQAHQPSPVDGGSLAVGSSPGAEVHTLERRREGAREEDGEQETEQAGRLPDVVRRRKGAPDELQRVAPDAQPERDGADERRTDALGREGGDDDHEREERDERLPGEGDAAIDELDLEHALPGTPQEQALQPTSQNGHALGHFAAPCARGRRLACQADCLDSTSSPAVTVVALLLSIRWLPESVCGPAPYDGLIIRRGAADVVTQNT